MAAGVPPLLIVESLPRLPPLETIVLRASVPETALTGTFCYLILGLIFYDCYIRNRVTSSSETEPRGTKRHAHRTSRSPSPLLNTKPAETCKPKRRYHDEGLPPIVPSASLLTIQLKSHRPDALLNGSEWDRVLHSSTLSLLTLTLSIDSYHMPSGVNIQAMNRLRTHSRRS